MRLALSLVLLLATPLFGEKGVTTVEASHANYDGDKITLSGNVLITNPMGTAQAQEAQLRKEEPRTQRIDFPYIELKDHVVVTFSNDGTLQCEDVIVDLVAMTSLFVSLPTQQLLYRDSRGEIFADRAIVDFASDEKGRYIPKKVTLFGHIRMAEIIENSQRYALCDYIEFYPETNKMILEGREGNKVLFFDDKRKMQLAAQSVIAIKDATSGKESIRGIGDVKFLFAKEEFDKLKQNFTLP